MNKNAPYIREIIDKTKQITGIRVQGNTRKEIQENVQLILKQQRQIKNQNART